jgi:hypothetical protein
MAVFACPGGGKSRFLDLVSEYLTSLRSDSPSCLGDSLVLAMSYNGVTCTPSGVDADLGLSASFSLAARIVWSHFIEQGQPTDQFFKFCRFLQENVPDMRVEDCLRLVMNHGEKPRVFLLIDELIASEIVSADSPWKVLSCIGAILDHFPNVNVLVSSLKPSPLLKLQSQSGRPIKWIGLPAFTLQESLELVEQDLSQYKQQHTVHLLQLMVSDLGGHPRGLETLLAVLNQHYRGECLPGDLMNSIVPEFNKFYPSLPGMRLNDEIVMTALNGRGVGLHRMIGKFSIEDLTANGVFLNSVINNSAREDSFPRLSMMQLRVFADTMGELSSCCRELAKTTSEFYHNEMELFHAQWEVLTRLVGWTGEKSLAAFYSSDQGKKWPAKTEKVRINFNLKTDGIIGVMDERSIFHLFEGSPSCRAVYIAKPGQAGFDMIMFEERAAGGHVAIFVANKYTEPGTTTWLKGQEPRAKLDFCLQWCEESQECKALGIKSEDCFLVVASWRNGEPERIQRCELNDPESRILVLGRSQLMSLYTPTLISRPQFILRFAEKPAGSSEIRGRSARRKCQKRRKQETFHKIFHKFLCNFVECFLEIFFVTKTLLAHSCQL